MAGKNVAVVNGECFGYGDLLGTMILAAPVVLLINCGLLCFSTTITKCCGAGFTQHEGAVVELLTARLHHLCKEGTA